MSEIALTFAPRAANTLALSLATVLSAWACSDGSKPADPGPHPTSCEENPQCTDGWVCREGACLEQCASTRDCARPTDLCDDGVCVAADSPVCTAHEQCASPSMCELADGALCLGGVCRYIPAPAGASCDHPDPCTRGEQCDGAGRCIGTPKTCDAPPPPVCIDDDSRFRVHTAPGSCDTNSGDCIYPTRDTACPGCQAVCMSAVCGDDILAPTEECDDGAANSDVQPDACRTNCLRAHCGDGVLDAGEACDDGNREDDGNGCTPGCTNNAVCGDGIVQDLFEGCDDGNTAAFDGCSSTCSRIAWKTVLSPDDTVEAAATLAITPALTLLIVPTVGGYIHALRVQDGELMWRYQVPGAQFLAAAVSLPWNKVVILDDRGVVHAIAADQGGATEATAAWTVELRPGESAQTPGIGLAVSHVPLVAELTSVIAVDELGTIYRIEEQAGVGVKTSFIYQGGQVYPDTLTSPAPGLRCERCTPTVLSAGSGASAMPVRGVMVPLSDGVDEGVWAWDFVAAETDGGPCPAVTWMSDPGTGLKGQMTFAWNGQQSVHDLQHKMYATTTDGGLLRLDAAFPLGGTCADLTLQSERFGGAGSRFGAAPVVKPTTQTQQQTIYTASLDGALRRFVWNLAANKPERSTTTYDVGAALESPPALSNTGQVFIGAADGTVHSLSQNLDHRWSLNVGDVPVGSPIVHLNVLHVVTRKGVVLALERGGFAPSPGWWSRQHGNASGQSTTYIVPKGCGAVSGPCVLLPGFLLVVGARRRRGLRRLRSA